MGDDGRLVGPPVPLESWWVPIGLLLGTAVLVGILLLVRRRGRLQRRGRLRRRAPVVALAVCGVLVSGAFGANSYAGYVPALGSIPALVGDTGAATVHGDRDLPPGLGSVVVSVTLGSAALRVPAEKVYLYLPPGYRTHDTRRYPVLYLYGGWPGRSTDWLIAGRLPGVMDVLIDQGRVRPMIVVMPDTTLGGFHDTECLDAVSGPRLETFLTRNLVRYVDRHFRTVANRSGRAVAGMSSGGFCALNLGLHHTDEFGAIAALEPYPSAGAGPEADALAGRPELIRRNTVTDYLPGMRFAGPVPVFLDWPRRASAAERADNRRIASLLRSRGQVVVTRTEAASHTWRQAQLATPAMLTFISGHLTPPGAADSTGRVPGSATGAGVPG